MTTTSQNTASRAVVFIDGANLYRALKREKLRPNTIDPYKVAQKLVQSRRLEEVRYYIAAIDRSAPARVYQSHVTLVALLSRYQNARLCFGHIQRIEQESPCAEELAQYLASPRERISQPVYQDLVALAKRHRKAEAFREKGVDVLLACDLVDLARQNAYDIAYLVSGDADFAPAVTIARAIGKRVFAASPDISARLLKAADVPIRLNPSWFSDCTI